MIFYDRETVNHALEFNDDIEFNVISLNDMQLVYTSEIFKNYEYFLDLYTKFPVLPSSGSDVTNNLFMDQRFPNIIENTFLRLTEMCVEKTLPVLKIKNQTEFRGNIGQYSKLSSSYNSIFPHMDTEFNYSMVCNYWVNVNPGDGTQFWDCEEIKTENDRIEYIKKNKIDLKKLYNWYNIEEDNSLKKKYFAEAKNNTCFFYFSNILHSPVINEDDNLRCSLVSWYNLVEKDDS